ncbi:MAG: flavodoxin domain-containing protein [Rubrivivax sp.]|nr:flavodoxin domain-containing protein [Rubrivivax sp.]
MNRKVLVAYASRAGSTGEVAQAIAERLCAQGLEAQVRPVAGVARLDGFQAVVLGSAIRYGAWLPEMLKFVQAQRAALAALPVAVFTVHMQALDDSPASRRTRSGYSQAVRALLAPRDEAFFAGKVDFATLSFFERLAVKLVKSPLGDQRDWTRIRAWADGLGAQLP